MKRLFVAVLIAVGTFMLPGIAASAPVAIGKAEAVHGTAFVVRNGEHLVLDLGEVIFPMDAIVTADSGRVMLTLDDGSRLFIAGNSQVGIADYSVEYGYRMSGGFNALRGKVRFVVQKVDGLDASFTVQTKSARIEVTGTDFTVNEPMGMTPTQILLRSGQVVATTAKEKGFIMKPGQLAQFISNGEIKVRNITPNEIASIDAPFEIPTGKPVVEAAKFEKKAHSGTVDMGAEAKQSIGSKKINTPKINTPKINTPKINTPKINTPKINEPKINAPKINEPKINEPKINEPKINEPKINEPKINEPKIHVPKVKAPKIHGPKL